MQGVITYDMSDRFIERLADDIAAAFAPSLWPRLAIVFGGRRPQLFLQRELARRAGKAVYSPRFFAIDEFMETIASSQKPFSVAGDLQSCFDIYRIAQRKTPELLCGRREFWRFLPWAQEILKFIEQLDLEDIGADALENVAANAQIGYDVPDNINALLGQLRVLREGFHKQMRDKASYSRGFTYLEASRAIARVPCDAFDRVLFCNFFYLHKTEEIVMKTLLDRQQAALIFQGGRSEWSVLEALSGVFSTSIEPATMKKKEGPRITFHAGFDLHSEIGLARQVLQGVPDPGRSVVVLPDPASVVPFLSEITSFTQDLNVSMGYPVARSSLYFLFDLVFRAQETRKGEGYYVKDYLGILSHPLTKNLHLGPDAAATRVLVHKIEEVLTGAIPTSLGGSLFVNLKDLEKEDALYEDAAQICARMGIPAGRGELAAILRGLHELFFESWESLRSFADFSRLLDGFLDCLLVKSPLEKYPLNLKILERLHAMNRLLAVSSFSHALFPQEEILRIFKAQLDGELISFSGSPLKGLQILGLFETRSLGFDDVIILDANESVLPKLKVYEPLIPRDVMTQLGLNRLEKEEEIQRYQFTRLIASARRAHIFYQERDDRPRSRFVEALIWEEEKRARAIGAVNAPMAAFSIKVRPRQACAAKKGAHIDFLKTHCFSASSVNVYMNCPLKFYYQYVLGLKPKDDVLDELEAADIGTFLHDFLEEFFGRFIGKKCLVDEALRRCFFKALDEAFDRDLARRMGRDAFLVREVLVYRMGRFLDNEARRSPKTIVALEQEIVDDVRLNSGVYRFQARLDRVDCLKDGSLLVLDYKTGSLEQMPAPASKFSGVTWDRHLMRQHIRSFQLPIYFHLFEKTSSAVMLNAGLYQLRDALKDGGIKTLFDSRADMASRRQDIACYLGALDALMRELFDPAVDFTADPSLGPYCDICPFLCLCR